MKDRDFICARGIATGQARPVVIRQAGFRQQTGSRTGDGSATGG